MPDLDNIPDLSVGLPEAFLRALGEQFGFDAQQPDTRRELDDLARRYERDLGIFDNADTQDRERKSYSKLREQIEALKQTLVSPEFDALDAEIYLTIRLATPRGTGSEISQLPVPPMRKLTGKSGQYQYYRCSRKADSGVTACKGSAIPMGELDGIVLDALEEKILAPKRLRKLTEALVSRAGERAGELSARRMELDGLRQKAKAEVTELYRLVGSGEIAMDATLSAHIKGLQDRVQSLTRQLAHLDAERSAPVEALSNETVRGFGRAVSAALRNPANRGFAKAYVQAIVTEISVSDREIRISGPKAALAHSAAVFAKKGELVPAFAQEWCTQEDSNL